MEKRTRNALRAVYGDPVDLDRLFGAYTRGALAGIKGIGRQGLRDVREELIANGYISTPGPARFVSATGNLRGYLLGQQVVLEDTKTEAVLRVYRRDLALVLGDIDRLLALINR